MLGALSLTTDLGAGVPFEKGLRTCVVASALADALELERADRHAAYFAALLRSLGCTAHASVFAEMFDDDVAVQRELKTLDLDDPEVARRADRALCDVGRTERAQELTARFAKSRSRRRVRRSGRGSCEVSAALGARLELPAGAIAALDEVYERYDGKGFPTGRAGDDLTVAARVVHVAEQAVMAHYDGGARGGGPPRRAARRRPPRPRHLRERSPRTSSRSWRARGAGHARRGARGRAAAGDHRARPSDLDRVCSAFASFADLKGRFLLGHSVARRRARRPGGRAARL